MTLQTPNSAGTCCGCIGDGTTILGTGIPGDPFRTAAANLNVQDFIHTVQNTDVGFGTDTLTINLPAARADTNYTAFAASAGRVDGAFSYFFCPQSGFTTTTVQVKCSATSAVGGKIQIIVQERTA